MEGFMKRASTRHHSDGSGYGVASREVGREPQVCSPIAQAWEICKADDPLREGSIARSTLARQIGVIS